MIDFTPQIRAAQPDDAAGIADLIVRLGTFQRQIGNAGRRYSETSG